MCKSNRNCAWNLAFIKFLYLSHLWNMGEHLHHESVYFEELHKEQEYYIQSGGAVVSTITS